MGGCGILYELMPSTHGWKEKMLHTFGRHAGDAALSTGNLIFDSSGNLYGTAAGGYYGYGAVFELKRTKSGWKESVIYSFNGGNEGGGPSFAPVAFDRSGNLYGTTSVGGAGNGGVVFELTYANGQWNEEVLHNFTGYDGAFPQAGVIIDESNNIYGTTTMGGDAGHGCG